MKGNNTVQLIGYVGKELKVFKTADSKKIVLRVATHEKYKDTAGVLKDTTLWHDVVAWDQVGDMAENNFVPGSHILVQGKLLHRTYTDKSGHRRYITEVRADHLMNLDR